MDDNITNFTYRRKTGNIISCLERRKYEKTN